MMTSASESELPDKFEFQINLQIIFSIIISQILYLFATSGSSVQLSRSVMSNSLQPHESQHARPPCPSPTPGVATSGNPTQIVPWHRPAPERGPHIRHVDLEFLIHGLPSVPQGPRGLCLDWSWCVGKERRFHLQSADWMRQLCD